jgi:Ssp1 endopeptidase immunity protein Rap1a
MRANKSFLATALLACAVPCGTATEAPLSAIELHAHCLSYRQEPSSAASQLCAAYVRGFLEGSTTAQGRIRKPAVAAESWLERAQRTRLRPQHSANAYCIDAAVSVAHIIEQLLLHADTHPPRAETPASAMLLAALQRFQSC